MIRNKKFKNLQAVFFDFDGVLTDNKVYTNVKGEESVLCDRSDGIAFKALEKLKIQSYIVSSETNEVVLKRAKKLKVKAFINIHDKKKLIKKIIKDKKLQSKDVIFIGNDINDYNVMKYLPISFCPIDSHPKVKKVASQVLKSNGGNGVVRELVEKVLKIDLINLLY